MNLLLDTCVLLWYLNDSPRLSPKFQEIIKNPNNIVFVSTASIWEISIKNSKGKLQIHDDLESFIKKSGFTFLDINFEHAWETRKLGKIHNDPFDRLLIAQAMIENLTILTADKHFHSYHSKILQVKEQEAEYKKVKILLASDYDEVVTKAEHPL